MFSVVYLETDRKKKNTAWLNKVVSEMRLSGYHALVDMKKANSGRKLINGDVDMEGIKKMFKNPDKIENDGFKFISLLVMEKIKNILTAEKQKAEIKAYVDSQDPTLIHHKKKDKNLLKNKNRIEKITNNMKMKLGLPPQFIGNEEFSGNYSDFEAMGFNSDNPMDVDTFFEYFYLLDVESLFQKVINHTFEINSVSELTTQFLEDIKATKTVVYQQFVSKVSGQITFRRIIPEHTFAIRSGKGKTEQHDVAVGYYERVTVNEFMKRAGNSFSFKEHYELILAGVNMVNSTGFTSIALAEGSYYGTNTGNAVTITNLLSYEVEIGYMEFKSLDIDNFREFKNPLGNTKLWPLREKDQETKNEYILKQEVKERTYYAYFLNTSPTSQIVYTGGLLYHQETEGQYDELSSYSLRYMQYPGKTIAEIATPWIEMANEAFTKFRFLLRKAKRDGKSYNLQSLVEVTKAFYNNDASPVSLQNMMNKLEDSADDIWSFPKNEQGIYVPIQGGVNRPNIDNFDSKFKSFKDIIEWCYQMIKQDIGINDLREGATPSTNDVWRLEQKSLEQSSNATYYIDDMMNYIYKTAGTTDLALLMDIVRFKSSVPYRYLVDVFGQDAIRMIEQLPKVSPHRMDIYVSSFANAADRARVYAESQEALRSGKIEYRDYYIINGINDHRKAQKYLVITMERFKKEQQKIAERQHEMAIELDREKTENQLKIQDRITAREVKKAQVMTDGYIKAAEINKRGKTETKEIEGMNDFESENLRYQQNQRKQMGVD